MRHSFHGQSSGLVVPRSSLLSFGLGLLVAGLGDLDGGLALSVEQSLLQGTSATLSVSGYVTLLPAAKLVLTVRSKLLLPVTGDFTLQLPGLLVTCPLPLASSAVSVVRDAVTKVPLRTVGIGFSAFPLLFLVPGSLRRDEH